MSNRLALETSPYLLQHAGNPVDWYPWGEEALRRARAEDKPIFLSIGYSSCHWCHVMERESFVDPDLAAFLNAHFVSIKVDREERPDLDAIYMQAVTALTGHGGWPLSVWLDPDAVPFYGGTYFPPAPRHGLPSFRQVLGAIAAAWVERRDELRQGATKMLSLLAEQSAAGRSDPSPTSTMDTADKVLTATFDPVHGGWGDAPKFPQPLVLEYLMAQEARSSSNTLDTRVRTTLDAMAAGGIYDHLGGGFHRYSTDERWLVPHFEKMLYDNAQLARCYLHAWQISGVPRYRAVVEESLDYLLERMRHPHGGFFSAEDADSEEREGAYYVWTMEEVETLLDTAEARALEHAYGLTRQGHIDGANVLHLAAASDGDEALVAEARAKLVRARQAREAPTRDEKIITGWNGLALAALAEAARALPSHRYRDAAVKTGSFIADQLMHGDHRLFHSWKDGRAAGNGFLEDYACTIDGLIALYQTTFDERWFVLARGCADFMLQRFAREEGGFYDTSDDHEALIVRPRSVHDSPTPCGNSLAATVLIKMAAYTGDDRYQRPVSLTLAAAPQSLAEAPMMFGQWLSAALLEDGGVAEVALVGSPDSSEGAALHSVLDRRFLPMAVVAARAVEAVSSIPLIQERRLPADLPAAAWVCRQHTCEAPTGDPERLAALLGP